MSNEKDAKVVAIVGAGPAGLTAALELLRRTEMLPVVFETDDQVGGISKTITYRGNRMDLGGHRFFSKSDWVMRWWQDILPVPQDQLSSTSRPLRTTYQGQSRALIPGVGAAATPDAVMLVRARLSRIFHRRRFFDYPLKLSTSTLRNMGAVEALKVGLSYGRAQMRRRRPETNLEDFLINHFGDRLYRTFFKDYTEKVWGVACSEISAQWGAQRIKGLSITSALAHAMKRPFHRSRGTSQKETETSLIERFLYPKLGPGQMWEEVARRVRDLGGDIHLDHRVVGIERDGCRITGVRALDGSTGSVRLVPCSHLISTMPVRDLTGLLDVADSPVTRIARALPYRDFMTVGLLLRRMQRTGDAQTSGNGMPRDNWIYIQEPDVKIGRLQIFNNWSPAMVADQATIWLGLEYFCREGDDLWSMNDAGFIDFAAAELEKIGLINRRDVLDGTLVRVPKAYPAYFGLYSEFGKIQAYLDRFSNLYPVGRNGMHRYNNQDHSMLTAKLAVDSIVNHGEGKSRIWDVNTESEYHEAMETSNPHSSNV